MPQRRFEKGRRRRRCGYLIEALEQRQLLTTLVTTAAGFPITLEYKDIGGHRGLITMSGNTTAEFIFYNPDLGGLVDAIDPAAQTGADLFQIYVAQSDIDSLISITPVDDKGNIHPFEGSVAGFRVIPANGRAGEQMPAAAPPGGSGTLVLGALLMPTGGGGTIPVVKLNNNGAPFGVRPGGLDDLPDDQANDLSAGLIVAGNQSLGKFLFGGTIFGKVLIPGNVTLFYAGWLLTGDARGADEGVGLLDTNGDVIFPGLPTELSEFDPFTFASPLVPRANFFVGGDLQNLATTGEIGWDGTYGTAPVPRTAPYFLSGTDIVVQGHLGEVHSLDGSAATVHIIADPSIVGPGRVQQEVEGINTETFQEFGGQNFLTFGDFSNGFLTVFEAGRDQNPFDNDGYGHAQYLGTFNSPLGQNTISVTGAVTNLTVDRDDVDYFGVGLLAGQKVRVWLQSGFLDPVTGDILGPGDLYVGVFDPDTRTNESGAPEHRLIATDYDNVSILRGGQFASRVHNQPFEFTAEKPGVYRFAVGIVGDVNFRAIQQGPLAGLGTFEHYTLDITNVGLRSSDGINYGIALGGYRVGNTETGGAEMLDPNQGVELVKVDNGDVGGIVADHNYHLTVPKLQLRPTPSPIPPPPTFANSYSIRVQNGNLRTFEAGDVSLGDEAARTILGSSAEVPLDTTAPDFAVPHGNIGLVRSRTGRLDINPSAQLTQRVSVVGGDYQIVEAGGSFFGGVVTDGGLGTLRAADMAELGSVIQLDFDNSGFDGLCDLIDAGLEFNGAALTHGPGGNFRYIRADSAHNDPFFSTGAQQRVTHDFNETVVFTDDSGSTITLIPVGQQIPNPNFDPLNPGTEPQTVGPRLTTRTYGVRSGGLVVMDVQSVSPDGLSLAGILITGRAFASGGSAEISRLEVSGDPPAPIVGTNTFTGRAIVALPPGTPDQRLTVDINGTTRVDVLYIDASTASSDIPAIRSVSRLSNISHISNTTGGEIVTVHALSIGDLYSKGTIGLLHNYATPAAVNPREVINLGSDYSGAPQRAEMPINPVFIAVRNTNTVGNTFPFSGQTYGIMVDGDVVSIRAGQGVGNIVVNGTIGRIIANADHQNTPGVFEGINAPVWAVADSAATTSTSPDLVGRILSINIGEGVLPSGTGAFSRAGIYTDLALGTVTNQGLGSDIRGDIVSGGTINSIQLRDGALIGGDIMILDTSVAPGLTPWWEASREGTPVAYLIPTVTNPLSRKTFQIGPVIITGTHGGVIGEFVQAGDVASENISGFGIFGSLYLVPFDGRLGLLTVGGYGIRDSKLGGGAAVSGINATGHGANLSSNLATPSVRQSESETGDPVFGVAFDPFSGQELNAALDLHRTLGTSAFSPIISGVTDTGVIEDVTATGQRSLDNVAAQTIRAKVLTTTNNPEDPNSPASISFPMQFTFANAINTVAVRGLINGLRVTSGGVRIFRDGGDVLAMNMQLSGPLQNMRIAGSLANDSTIAATGPNGNIGAMVIGRDLIGTVRATGKAGNIIVGHDVMGSILIDGRTQPGTLSLDLLRIGGSFGPGTIDITGDVGSVQSAGDFGISGDTFIVTGNLGSIRVGYRRGGAMNANLAVDGNLGVADIFGPINGSFTIGGNTSLLRMRSATPNASLINNAVSIAGNLTRADIRNGNVAHDVSVTGSIGTFAITDGSLSPGATVQSINGNISTFRVLGGNIFGSIFATSGRIGSIITSGNLGDGSDPLTIATNALDLLSIGGSILSGVTVNISGPLGTLYVGGNLEAGATVIARSLARNRIQGQTLGSLLIG